MASKNGLSTPPPVGFRFDVRFSPNIPAGKIAGIASTAINSLIDPEAFGGDGPDASFQEVSGISVEFETETVKDGAESMFSQKLPLKPNYSDLVLKRGLLLNSAIMPWFNATLNNKLLVVIPMDVEVELKNEKGDTLIGYHFSRAWPRKWSLSGFNAMESSLVFETLELSYQYFRVNFNG